MKGWESITHTRSFGIPMQDLQIGGVRLFNLKFSPNLGDGLLSVALEKALVEHGCDELSTYSVDMAGRSSFGPGRASRSFLLKTVEGMPPTVRQVALQAPLAVMTRMRWRPHYEAGLAGARAIVVGGGNLFADMDLNFPTKLAAILNLAAGRRLPVAIYGVGVAAGWSEKGLRMVRQALARSHLCYASVRDRASKEHFDELFAEGAGRRADIVRDPGLLISRYVPPSEPARERRAVGLCVTSPIAVRYHSSSQVADAELADWYAGLCRTLSGEERSIIVFTNGSPEDELFLDRIAARLEASAGSGYVRRRIRTPTELALLVSDLAALVAHRMHALIAGYSFTVPIVALQWDRKVDSFMESIGAADRIAPAVPGTEEAVAALLRQLLAGPPPKREDRDRIVNEALLGVGGLATALRNALGGPPS